MAALDSKDQLFITKDKGVTWIGTNDIVKEFLFARFLDQD
jgi:hypothetical protein